ncbi:MAG TPA: metallophosphoesterase family protein [Blastocatellia bacterium]|nr:metallophosphoesterase family protein [Blastocatellia bacterium]
MRVAAIYDIHGNLPALEAVLDEIRDASVDLILVGGDVVPGPMPAETLARLLDLDRPVEFLRGNCEVAVLAEMTGTAARALPPQAREAVAWTARELRPEDAQAFARWPMTVRLAIEGIGDVLFCHATPRDEDECFTRLTPDELLVPIFEHLDVALVVCGHTHMQFDRSVGGIRVVNAGSVGMPFGEPGADWLLLGPDVQLRHTAYDFDRAVARIRATDYPQAEEFAASSVLRPPSEDTMLAAFAKADAKLADPVKR